MKLAWFNTQSTSKTPAFPVEERLDRLEAAHRALTLEWEDTYERIMRTLRRLNKRAQDARLLAEKEEAETSQDAPGPTISNPLGLDPISLAVHARRARVPPRIDGR